jgi:NAD-dependent dihydropyrimidine dehydrogenase PreA subunit
MIRWLLGLAESSQRPTLSRRTNRQRRLSEWSRRDVLTLGRRRQGSTGPWSVGIEAARCSDCSVCVRICSADALSRSVHDDRVVYTMRPVQCDGCSDCETVCATNALRVHSRAETEDRVEVVSLQLLPCSECGRASVGLAGGICVICRQQRVSLPAKRNAFA